MTVLIILGVKNDTGDTDTSWLLSVAISSVTSEAKQPTEGFCIGTVIFTSSNFIERIYIDLKGVR